VFGSRITRMRRLRKGNFMIAGTAASVGKMAACPRATVVIGQIYTAVVPGIPVSIEAPSGFDRYQRRLGHVAGSIFEEGASRRMGRVLSSVKEGRDRGHAARFSNFVEDGATFASSIFIER
jgi:hypothetical protein